MANGKKLTIAERMAILETKMDMVVWAVRLLIGTNLISVVGIVVYFIAK